MKLLLDTHIVVWWGDNSPRLAPAIRAVVADSANEVFLSSVSWWELAIKAAKGHLAIPTGLRSRLRQDGFRDLPITAEHALGVARLPLLHRDPFDRLLVAQALAEGLVLVTHDDVLTRYDVPVLEA